MKKLSQTYFLTLIIVVVSTFNALAGVKLLGVVQWNEQPERVVLLNGTQVFAPHFKEAVYKQSLSNLPVIVKTLPLTGNVTAEVVLESANYANIDVSQYSGIDFSGSEVSISTQVLYEKKQPTLAIYVVPFRTNPLTGQVQKLVDYTLDITLNENTTAKTSKKAAAANSVLNSGSWYKMAVSATGIHKIDYALLEELGMDPANIDPRNLHVYGNGGGMLPQSNSTPRHDDLVENAIVVVGEADGSFDPGDYILFYAEGPSLWSYDDADDLFKYNMNVYSANNFYFITANNSTGKRVAANASSGTANNTVTTFNDYANHEVDEVNLIRSGRKWFGDYFNFSITSRSFNFSFPNIVTTEPVTIRTEVAARSTSSASSMPIQVNGQQLHTHALSTVSTNYTAAYASVSELTSDYTASSAQIGLTVSYSNASSSAEGWLSFIELNARRNLVYSSGELRFRDANSFGAGNVSEFVIQGGDANVSIWDVTDPTTATAQQFAATGGQMRFTTTTDVLKEFVAFRQNGSFAKPIAVGAVANQNLHGIGQPDMVIVTTVSLMSEAQRLADHHTATKGLEVAVVDIEQVYNEFSSGRLDVTAIRDFLKLLYDNAGTDVDALPQYFLLMGDASYDFRNIRGSNENHIPTYESFESISPVGSFCTDDYFGFLDDTEGSSLPTIQMSQDLAIGRLPVKNIDEARAVVDKIIHYTSPETFGSWRNNITFIGDDEDGNLHFRDANDLANQIEGSAPVYNVKKIYLDAYKQQSTPAGSRYPDVKDEINRSIFQGTLLMDYVGHGGTSGWAHERVVDLNDIRGWDNFDKMPLMVTATCEFTRHDDPDKVSAGEEVMLNPLGGAIGLVTTVRLVYASANKETNVNFLDQAFSLYNGTTRMPTVGEAVMVAKNNISSSALNARKFMLIGDPAMTLAYPQENVVTTTINGGAIDVNTDTLSALEEVTICGEVRDASGAVITNFNGFVYPTIFDKTIDVETLGNDPQSSKASFESLSSIIFKGKASVVNGEFCYSFIVPKDISYNFGAGKISYYADNCKIDAHGYTFDFVIGGTATGYEEDNTGPTIQVFMNDESFRSGGMTDANPLLLVKLYDLHGINTAGNGVGHDITAVLDDNTSNTYVLNDYYESATDNYAEGKVLFPLTNLEEGLHRIRVKAWDVYNNSADGYTDFIVSSSPGLALNHVLNYPNPFVGATNFSFEHNKAGEQLFVEVTIYNMAGQKIKVLKTNVEPEGYVVNNIEWDGTNDLGAPITKGVYLYRLEVSTTSGEKAHKVERLVIIK